MKKEIYFDDEILYLKKDYFGWRIYQPIKNKDGSYNWLNLIIGGKKNAFALIIILLIMGFVMWSYHHDVSAIQNNYKNISADPIAWCKDVNLHPSAYRTSNINLTNINLGG